VVATSNREPETLYQNGLNRALFLPFIAMINARMDVVELRSRTDYRLEKLAGEVIYHVPANAASRHALDMAFLRLTGGQPGTQGSVSVKDRTIPVSCQAQGVARFYFEDLCEKPLGARDYLALARAYHTLIVEDVPKLTFARRNEAKRFITLIDILYENRVKLLLSAASEPQALYEAERGHEAFEFDRTVSRLVEMRSQAYLALPHGALGGDHQGDSGGLVET
jgi:cell division protein ZapE